MDLQLGQLVGTQTTIAATHLPKPTAVSALRHSVPCQSLQTSEGLLWGTLLLVGLSQKKGGQGTDQGHELLANSGYLSPTSWGISPGPWACSSLTEEASWLGGWFPEVVKSRQTLAWSVWGSSSLSQWGPRLLTTSKLAWTVVAIL